MSSKEKILTMRKRRGSGIEMRQTQQEDTIPITERDNTRMNGKVET